MNNPHLPLFRMFKSKGLMFFCIIKDWDSGGEDAEKKEEVPQKPLAEIKPPDKSIISVRDTRRRGTGSKSLCPFALSLAVNKKEVSKKMLHDF